jgi:modification methylase
MPPNIELPLDSVITGDCVQAMAGFPPASVDVVFADPPYNLQLQKELWRPNLTRVDAVNDAWDRFETFADYDRFTRAWLEACRRVLKDTGTLWVIGTYHNIHRVGAILQDLGYWILNEVAWIKLNPMPNFRGVRFTNAHETLIWAQKQQGAAYTFNHRQMKAANDGLQMRSDWILPLCTGKERIKIDGVKAHAAQKPEALLKRVILSSTNPGDVVLDPFFGTGTTGAVARRYHRRWIGIESDPAYVEIARSRIEAVMPLEAGDLGKEAKPRKPRRIPFGVLVDSGLVQPGQTLYAGGKDGVSATVLPEGQIRCGEVTGSIHQVAHALENAPCNGWAYWQYEDEHGARQPIDELRKLVARELE